MPTNCDAIMPPAVKWFQRPRAWLEFFALFNLAGLAPDIFLAHSTNSFRTRAEYIPLIFSLVAPVILLPAIGLLAGARLAAWRWLGQIVGWTSVAIGIAGLVLHLRSQFFQQWTLASLVYAAPFAAPLAYTGIGSLLIMNRMVEDDTIEWAQWVIFLAGGGFAGNFIFSVTDHAQNGFFHRTEWIPVISSAIAVGFLIVPLSTRVNRVYLIVCGWVLLGQFVVGALGFFFHARADWHNVGATLLQRIIHGAPIFAPTLFCDLAVLAGIGLWRLGVLEGNARWRDGADWRADD